MIMRTCAFDMAIYYCWIRYEKDAGMLNVPKKNIMDLVHFRMDLTENLILVGQPITSRRRGRPTSGKYPSTKRNKVLMHLTTYPACIH